jgi:hypothetical protein
MESGRQQREEKGRSVQILMNYPIKEIVCRDLATASSDLTIRVYPASFEGQ